MDPVSGSGGVPPRSVVNQSQDTERVRHRQDDQNSRPSSREAVDEVSISQEAISLQQAEQAAAETRELLENSERALGIVTDDIE